MKPCRLPKICISPCFLAFFYWLGVEADMFLKLSHHIKSIFNKFRMMFYVSMFSDVTQTNRIQVSNVQRLVDGTKVKSSEGVSVVKKERLRADLEFISYDQ